MGEPRPPEAAILLVGTLSSSAPALAAARAALEAELGAATDEAGPFPFDHTDYYNEEIGTPIERRVVAFGEYDPARLAATKLATNRIEAEVAAGAETRAPRPVNLDPGYLTIAKLVLATTKNAAHRVYLGDGIYAEATLAFREGAYRPFPWTYQDYAAGTLAPFLSRLRGRLRQEGR